MKQIKTLKHFSKKNIINNKTDIVRCFSNASLDFRRLRRRSGWIGRQDQDPDYFLLTDNRLGNDVNVNWSLNRYGVTPEVGDAFHNLHERGLLMYSNGKFDKNKALVVDTNANDNHKILYVNNTNLPSNVEKIEERRFAPLLNQTRDHISSRSNIFMNDGGLGTTQDESSIRTISDNANSSLALSRLLHFSRIPLEYVYRVFDKENRDITHQHKQSAFYQEIVKLAAENKSIEAIGSPEEKQRLQSLLEKGYNDFFDSPEHQVKMGIANDITTFVARDFQPDKSLGLPSQFSVVDLTRGIVLVVGSHSSQQLVNSLLPLASHQLERSNILSLFSHTYSNIGVEGNTLFFDSSNLLSRSPVLADGLVGANASFFSEGRLYSGFRGASFAVEPSQTQRSDYVEKNGSSLNAVRRFRNAPRGNVTNVVFSVNDTNGSFPALSRLSRSQAAQFYLLGYNGSSNFQSLCSPLAGLLSQESQANLFQQFLDTQNVQDVYVLNSSLDTKVVSSALHSVRDGSAKKNASQKVSHVFDLEEVKLAGVKSNAKAQPKVDELQKLITQRKSEFPNFKW